MISIKAARGIAIFIVAVATITGFKWGAGITPDSCGYISAAKSFAANQGFIQYNGTILTNWPLLYPLLLSAAGVFRIDFLLWPIILNTLTVIAVLVFMSKKINSDQFVLLSALLISYPMMRFQLHALTETLFVCTLIILLHFIKDYYKQARIASLLTAAVFAALSCMLRYAGIYLCLTISALILLQIRDIKHALLFAFISIAPVAGNLYYNMLLPQSFSAVDRAQSFDKIKIIASNVTAYFSYSPAAAFFIVLLPVVILFYLFVTSKPRFNKLLCVICLVYIPACLSANYLGISDYVRYLIIFVPVIVSAESTVLNKPVFNKLISGLFVLNVIAFVPLPYIIYTKGTGGYNKLSWQNDLLKTKLDYVRKPILTNAADYLWYLNETSSDYLANDEKKVNMQLRQTQTVIWVDGIRDDYMSAVKQQLDHSIGQKETGNRFTIYRLN